MLSQDGGCRHIAGTREYGTPKGKKGMVEQEKHLEKKQLEAEGKGDES